MANYSITTYLINANMNKTIGKIIKELREKNGLTLEDLANKIESSKSYIWDLENKPNIRPSAETVYKLATSLDTTVNVLMGEKSIDDLEELDQAFFRNYQKLSPPTKKTLSDILEALKKGEQ